MSGKKNGTITINGKNFVVIAPKASTNPSDAAKCSGNFKLQVPSSDASKSKQTKSEEFSLVPTSKSPSVAGSSQSSKGVVRRPLIKIVPRCVGLTPPTTGVVKLEQLDQRFSQSNLTNLPTLTTSTVSHLTPVSQVSHVKPASVFLLTTSANAVPSPQPAPSNSSNSQSGKRKVGYWTNEQVRELITIYRNFPCLYEMGSDDYLDKYKKREAWQYITKLIAHSRPNTTEDEVKAKWNALRTNYSAELGKLEKSVRNGANPNKVFVSSMTFFNDIDFLRPYMSIRKGTASIKRLKVRSRRRESAVIEQHVENEGTQETEEIEEPEETESEDLTTIYDAVDAVLNSEEEGNASDTDPLVPEVSMVVPSDEEPVVKTEASPEPKPETRKRKRFKADLGAKQFLREASSILSKIQSLQETHSEQKPFDGFCSFIGETLRGLPEDKAQKLRNEIMQTILNFS